MSSDGAHRRRRRQAQRPFIPGAGLHQLAVQHQSIQNSQQVLLSIFVAAILCATTSHGVRTQLGEHVPQEQRRRRAPRHEQSGDSSRDAAHLLQRDATDGRTGVARLHSSHEAFQVLVAADRVAQVSRQVAAVFRPALSVDPARARIARGIRESVVVRISVRPRLEASHAQRFQAFGTRQHGGHHHAHGQLRAQRDLESYQVGRVADEAPPSILSVRDACVDRRGRLCRRRVQTMHVRDRVVLAVQRPPHRGDAAAAERVLHERGPFAQLLARAAANPRRQPRQILHCTPDALALVAPLHR